MQLGIFIIQPVISQIELAQVCPQTIKLLFVPSNLLRMETRSATISCRCFKQIISQCSQIFWTRFATVDGTWTQLGVVSPAVGSVSPISTDARWGKCCAASQSSGPPWIGMDIYKWLRPYWPWVLAKTRIQFTLPVGPAGANQKSSCSLKSPCIKLPTTCCMADLLSLLFQSANYSKMLKISLIL